MRAATFAKITLQFPSRCRHCGRKLRIGERAWYYLRKSDNRTFIYCGSHRQSTFRTSGGEA
jgi:hypothetical protein